MKKVFLFAFIMSLLGCASETKEQENMDSTDIKSNEKIEKIEQNGDDYLALLQGDWKSSEDPNYILSIKGNARYDLYEEKGEGEMEEFTLEKTCKYQDGSIAEDTKKYMNMAISESCLYIVEVNENYLELSNVGRGNTLKFNKISTED